MKHPLILLLIAVLFSLPAWAEEPPRTKGEMASSFAPVVKKVAPAVVNIYTRTLVRGIASPFMNDPFFRQFFGESFPGGGIPVERIQSSLGSGVIVSPEGLVVTNNHVVANAEEVTVVLSDRREFEADVVSKDARTDLAMLRLRAKGETFPTLSFADSDEVEVGDLVLAIGNPFGVGQTVSMGIVSATARTGVTRGSDVNYFIQTDAAINPGNSGGALVSSEGRLVGIPSAIYSRDGGSIGIGFAIPSNLVKAVLASVGKEGKITRGWTGVYTQTLTSELAKSVGLDRAGGVIVKRLHSESPAKKAGIAVGDVLRAVNGKSVEDEEAFRFRLATTPVGSPLVLQVLKKGQKEPKDIEFKLSAPPDTDHKEKKLEGRQPLAGAYVANLSPALAEELNLPDDAEGVIVMKVDRRSAAANLGITRGDVIVRVNRKEVANVKELEKALIPTDQGWNIQLARGNAALTLMVGP
jgi:Do/DeqQ family serine protease